MKRQNNALRAGDTVPYDSECGIGGYGLDRESRRICPFSDQSRSSVKSLIYKARIDYTEGSGYSDILRE